MYLKCLCVEIAARKSDQEEGEPEPICWCCDEQIDRYDEECHDQQINGEVDHAR